MKKVVIVGVGFPDVLSIVDSINKKRQKIKILGFLDDNKKTHGKVFWSHKVLGNISWLKNKKNIYVINSVAKNCKVRERVFKKIRKYSSKFINIIDPNISIKNVSLSKGIIINKGASLGYDCEIGFGSILSWDSHLGHGSVLGKYCFLSKGSTVLGNAKIGNKVYIGSNASILPKVSVASDCNIFSNATVIQNLATKSFIIDKNS